VAITTTGATDRVEGRLSVAAEEDARSRTAYWRANLRLVGGCLVVWFVVSFGFGILLVDWLDRFEVLGVRLGFWFAQQGSIYVFLALIPYYVVRVNRLDREHDVHED
jgi:putative solute:sodium symporter small subunit